MKKVHSYIAPAILAVLILGGCGGAGKDAEEQVTLEIFQFKVEIVEQLDALVEDFEADYPHIDVIMDTVGGGTDYGSALRQRFNSGEEPGIFNVGGAAELTSWKHTLEPLTSEAWVAEAFDGALDGITDGGEVYGQPYNQEGYGIIYNKGILADAGYSEADMMSISTLDELEAVFADLESQKDALGIETVLSFSLGGTAWWTASIHAFNVALANQDDPAAFVEAGKAGTADFAGNAYMNGFLDMIEVFIEYSYDNLITVDYNDQVANFGLGKTAFLHQGNWTIGTLLEIDPELDMAFLPHPLGNSQEFNSIPVGIPNNWTVNSNKTEAEVEAAKLFLNYMAMTERGEKFIVEDCKFIPAFGNMETTTLDPLGQSIVSYSQEGNTIPWVWFMAPTGWLDSPTSPVMTALQVFFEDGDRDEFFTTISEGLVELAN